MRLAKSASYRLPARLSRGRSSLVDTACFLGEVQLADGPWPSRSALFNFTGWDAALQHTASDDRGAARGRAKLTNLRRPPMVAREVRSPQGVDVDEVIAWNCRR